MLGKEIKSNRAVPLSEVSAMLEAREKDGELGFEQKSALTYAQKFAHLSKEKSHELMAKLSELPFVSESMSVKLVDLMPKTEEDVILILQQEKRDTTSAQCKQVLEILSSL